MGLIGAKAMRSLVESSRAEANIEVEELATKGAIDSICGAMLKEMSYRASRGGDPKVTRYYFNGSTVCAHLEDAKIIEKGNLAPLASWIAGRIFAMKCKARLEGLGYTVEVTSDDQGQAFLTASA